MSTESDDNPNESTLNNSQDGEKNLWSPEEIIVLINLWEEFNKDLRKLGRHAKTYHQITERLQQELEREVPYTVKQVIKKIENLKRQYNYNKNKFRSETNPSPWRYYKMIHRFLHPLPKDDKTLVKQEISVYQQNPPVEVLLEDGLTQMLEQELLRLHGEQTEETDSDSHSPTASLVATPAFSAPSPSTITNAPSTSTSVPLSRHPPSSEGSCILEGVDISCHNSPTRKRKRNSLDVSEEAKLSVFRELIALKRESEQSRNETLKDLVLELHRNRENQRSRERLLHSRKEKGVSYLSQWQKNEEERWHEWRVTEEKLRREWEVRMESKMDKVESKIDSVEVKIDRVESKIDKILDFVSAQDRTLRNIQGKEQF